MAARCHWWRYPEPHTHPVQYFVAVVTHKAASSTSIPTDAFERIPVPSTTRALKAMAGLDVDFTLGFEVEASVLLMILSGETVVGDRGVPITEPENLASV